MNLRSVLRGCLLLLALATAAHAAVTLVDSQPFTNIDAYTATADVTVTSTGEAATLVIEYGPTATYGSRAGQLDIDAGPLIQLQYTVAGFAPNTSYHYRYKLTGKTSKAVVTSSDRTFTTIAATDPTAPSAPAASSVLMGEGGQLTFSLSGATGSAPLVYQWQKNAVNYGAATTSPFLAVNPVKLSDGGTWTCKVSNPGANAISPGRVVTVVGVTRIPAKIIPEGGSFTTTVTINPPDPTATYSWHAAGSASLPSGIGSVTGQASATLSVSGLTPQANADYECDVTVGGQTLTVPAGTVSVGEKPVIVPILAMNLRVGTPVSQFVEISGATSQTITGLPPGLKYVPAAKTIAGAPIGPTPIDQPALIVITAANEYGTRRLVVPVTVNPLDPSVLGTFVGTVDRGADPRHIGGSIVLTVAPTGMASGALTLGKAVYPIKAPIVSTAANSAVTLDILSLRSAGGPPTHLNLSLDAHSLAGTAANGAGSAMIAGRRVPWHALNPVPIPGNFNCALQPTIPAPFPQGAGYAILSISPVGQVKIVGRAADGTPLSAGTVLGDTGDVPVFLPLYGGGGSILGTLTVAGRDVTGALTWNKPPGIGGRVYGDGFALATISASGRRWVPPQPILDEIILGLAPTTNNAKLTFTGPTLTAPVVYPFTISALSAPIIPTGLALNPNSVALKIDAKTGLISGSFKVSDPNPVASGSVTRPASYFGLAIPGQSKALGFFTIPNLPTAGPPVTNLDVTKNPVQSGAVELTSP